MELKGLARLAARAAKQEASKVATSPLTEGRKTIEGLKLYKDGEAGMRKASKAFAEIAKQTPAERAPSNPHVTDLVKQLEAWGPPKRVQQTRFNAAEFASRAKLSDSDLTHLAKAFTGAKARRALPNQSVVDALKNHPRPGYDDYAKTLEQLGFKRGKADGLQVHYDSPNGQRISLPVPENHAGFGQFGVGHREDFLDAIRSGKHYSFPDAELTPLRYSHDAKTGMAFTFKGEDRLWSVIPRIERERGIATTTLRNTEFDRLFPGSTTRVDTDPTKIPQIELTLAKGTKPTQEALDHALKIADGLQGDLHVKLPNGITAKLNRGDGAVVGSRDHVTGTRLDMWAAELGQAHAATGLSLDGVHAGYFDVAAGNLKGSAKVETMLILDNGRAELVVGNVTSSRELMPSAEKIRQAIQEIGESMSRGLRGRLTANGWGEDGTPFRLEFDRGSLIP